MHIDLQVYASGQIGFTGTLQIAVTPGNDQVFD